MKHITVLKNESIAALNLSKDAVVVDATFGSGGHAEAILSQLGKKGTYIGIDVDPTAIESGTKLLSTAKANVKLVCDNFRNIDAVLNALHIEKVDAILADLGWRMEQFDASSGLERGFSFNLDEPLLMTFGNPSTYAFTAHDIINEWKEEDIANVIFAYGQERYARRIARRIVEVRQNSPIDTSLQLASIVEKSVPSSRKKRTHPATKTFQALRIAVNDEFDALQGFLDKGFLHLQQGGHLSVITFHSLEDKIVKETFKSFVRDQKGVLVYKKPLPPTLEEQKDNPRARSAKMRTIEKI